MPTISNTWTTHKIGSPSPFSVRPGSPPLPPKRVIPPPLPWQRYDATPLKPKQQDRFSEIESTLQKALVKLDEMRLEILQLQGLVPIDVADPLDENDFEIYLDPSPVDASDRPGLFRCPSCDSSDVEELFVN